MKNHSIVFTQQALRSQTPRQQTQTPSNWFGSKDLWAAELDARGLHGGLSTLEKRTQCQRSMLPFSVSKPRPPSFPHRKRSPVFCLAGQSCPPPASLYPTRCTFSDPTQQTLSLAGQREPNRPKKCEQSHYSDKNWKFIRIWVMLINETVWDHLLVISGWDVLMSSMQDILSVIWSDETMFSASFTWNLLLPASLFFFHRPWE